jgi:hypothetical protein
MNTPYDNGKVKIGIYYQKPLKCEMSKDMELLQGALLGQQPTFLTRAMNLLYFCTIVVVVLSCIIYF